MTGTANPASFTMPAIDISVQANYLLATHRLNFQSAPVGVQVTVKVGANAAVPLNSGQYMDIPEGETVIITAPTEVTA